jgi:hypothetical protein
MSKTKKSGKSKSNSKSKSKCNSKSRKCDKEYTYGWIVGEYYKLRDGLSNATINKNKKLNNRVKIYKDDMYRTHDCMLKLYKKVKDADKKEDLRIMINNLEIIIKQVEKGIKL